MVNQLVYVPVYLTWLIDGVGDEVLPQLSIILLLGKLNGLVYICQFLHDHLQCLPAVAHPACRGQQHRGIITQRQELLPLISHYYTTTTTSSLLSSLKKLR